MPTINFFDALSVEINGTGDLATSLKEYYGRFLTKEERQPTDLNVTEINQGHEPDIVLGDPTKYLGRSNDEFIISNSRGFITINSDWTNIRATPRSSHFHVSYLIEYKLRSRLVDNGFALIHASGVTLDGNTYLFPAWQHTGKTNTLLSLIREGGGYLADDRVWVNRDGTVLGYPLPINMLPYNFESFPNLSTLSTLEWSRKRLNDFINEQVDLERSIIDKVVYFFNQYYIDRGFGEVVHIDDLLPAAEFVPESIIDELVFLQTHPNVSPAQLNVDSMQKERGAKELMAINFFEWNKRIKTYCYAFDILFPGGQKVAEFETLVQREEEIFDDLIENTKVRRLNLPREERWNENGMIKWLKDEFLRE